METATALRSSFGICCGHRSSAVRSVPSGANGSNFVHFGTKSRVFAASVVTAMRTKGGDLAVFQTLNRARELYRNKLQASAAADQLASLFAECAIAEALPLKSETSQNTTEHLSSTSEPSQNHMVGGPFFEPDLRGTSILSESGRNQIVLDAFSDGSSFVCLKCGGLVSNHRKDEHYMYWCCQI